MGDQHPHRNITGLTKQKPKSLPMRGLLPEKEHRKDSGIPTPCSEYWARSFIISSNPRVRYNAYRHGHTLLPYSAMGRVNSCRALGKKNKESSQRDLPSRLGRQDTGELASCGFSELRQEEAE